MKKIALTLMLVLITLFSSNVFGQVTIGSLDPPDPSAILELKPSTHLGLLLPRVPLTGITDVITIPNPATGLVVYNTGTVSTFPEAGFVYWDGAQWSKLGGAGGPWMVSGTTDFSVDNLDSIYQTGPVTIGKDTLIGSAMLNVEATDKGVLVPRLTEDERDAIVDPANGLLIYNTDEDCFNYYFAEEEEWLSLCGGPARSEYTVDCDGITVHGTYVEGSPVDGSHYMRVKVDVTKAGPYTFSATTENGYGFHNGGVYLEVGEQYINVPAQGKPIAANNSTPPGDGLTFTLNGKHFEAGCNSLFITVYPPNAAYEMVCGSAIVNGAYVKGRALGPNNTISIVVNVTDVSSGGSWSVQSNTSGGISFEGAGMFTTAGRQTITLQGYGTPTTTQPINLTLTATTKDGEATCFVVVRVAYPKMTVYTWGERTSYGYNLATSGTASNTMITSPVNFGIADNSTVKAEGFEFIDGGSNPTNAAIRGVLSSANPPDIVIAGYYWISTGTDNVADDILEYLKKGGTVLFYVEDNATVQLMMQAIFGDNTVSAGSGGGAGTRYRFPLLPNDPIINGPFGDLGGLYWGEDASTTTAVSGISTNPNAMVYSLHFNTSNVTAFRHTSMNFVFVGDGGFNSNGPESMTICPFRLDSQNRPSFKPNYGLTSGNGTGPVHNAVFTANAIAWALEQATYNGINEH